MRSVRTKMTIPPVMEDVYSLLQFIENHDATNDGLVGVHGYCMSGPTH